jgi:hypothetical protein
LPLMVTLPARSPVAERLSLISTRAVVVAG